MEVILAWDIDVGYVKPILVQRIGVTGVSDDTSGPTEGAPF
jgi:hypothetical protein